jgi:hypothetical protein
MQQSHFGEIHAFAQKGGLTFDILGAILSDVRSTRHKAKPNRKGTGHLFWCCYTLEKCRGSSIRKNSYASC